MFLKFTRIIPTFGIQHKNQINRERTIYLEKPYNEMSLIEKIKTIWQANDSNYNSTIKEIAESIFNDYYLILNGDFWSIVELEMYLYTSYHKDPFVHKHSINKLPFYNTGQLRSHKSGIDIAISNVTNNSYGGILLRTINKEGSSEVIEGPLNVQKAIIKNMGDITNSSFQFVNRKQRKNDMVYQTVRVGLYPKKEILLKEQLPFLFEKSRFFTNCNLDNEKYIIALTYQDSKNCNIANLDTSTWKNYKEDFEEGKLAESIIFEKLHPFNQHKKAFAFGYYSNLYNS
jgi:hypothetical protein